MLELAGLRIDHPSSGAPLVDDAWLELPAGIAATLSAPAGSGGSLLVATLVGERRPAAGVVRLLGRSPHALRASALRRMRRQVALWPQAPVLVPDLDVLGQVRFAAELLGRSRRDATAAALRVLEQVGLLGARDARPDELPQAARARIALARALVAGPRLLLADEPCAAQDDAGVVIVAEAISELTSGGATALLVSRDPRLAAAGWARGWTGLALDGGRIVSDEVDLDRAAPELILDLHTAPRRRASADDAIPNVLPFPVTARSARVG